MAAKVRRSLLAGGRSVRVAAGTGSKRRQTSAAAEAYLPCFHCRWFILKDGKIFWFKTDIVGPVSLSHQGLHHQPRLGAAPVLGNSLARARRGSA